jgi:AcrR family transcriptional regulator
MKVSRAPQQERSTQSLARLLDAAERLMRRYHFEDISVAEIAREAQTSVGNFYARFASKEALLDALHERYEEDRTKIWRKFFEDPALAHLPLAERTGRLVQMVIKIYRERGGVFRTLVIRQWRHPDTMGARTRTLLGGLYETAFAMLLEDPHEIRHPHPERAVRVGVAAILAACRENIVMRPKSLPASQAISDEEFANEMSRMLVAYLTGPPASTGHRVRT